MVKEKDRISKILIENDPNKRLEVQLFDVKIPSPLILGSGPLVEKAEQIPPYLEAGVGAVVPRTTRKIMERKIHPSPHIYQTGQKGQEMILNAEWTGADIESWKPYLNEIAKTEQVIMSISGRDITGCTEVCKTLDEYKWPYLELNVSCAHSNSQHGFITRDSEHIKNLIESIKSAGVKTPIAIKLGHSDMIVHLASVAKEAGADAIVAINTYGPLFDFTINDQGNPFSILGIESAKGGMSGSPLFNIALTDVAEISHQVDIPVIACGGVSTAENVIKMIMAGASAVQVYTAAHIRGINAPNFFSNLNLQILRYMDQKNIEKISQIKGRAIKLLDQKTNLNPLIPNFHLDKCNHCRRCEAICLHGAIELDSNGNLYINKEKCIGCGHCTSICPTQALTASANFIKMIK